VLIRRRLLKYLRLFQLIESLVVYPKLSSPYTIYSLNDVVLSTAYNNQPNSRYMVFYNDELTLYTKTSNESTKVEEIKNNPYAYILLGYKAIICCFIVT
jgi:pyridoxine/pyridoxamine 5'-phosphate oxidase